VAQGERASPRSAAEWAYLLARLAEEKRRVNVNDVWIAAIAAANQLAVVTQDGDYEVIHEVGGPAVIRV
jgi:predicted nucleic acid-binding protein